MSLPEIYKRMHEMNIPHVDADIADLMKNVGKMAVYDDRYDIYQFSSIRHTSRLHHWYPGAFTAILGELGGMIAKMGVFMQSFSEGVENRGEQDLGVILRQFIQDMPAAMSEPAHDAYNNMKSDIKAERAIPLEDLKQEYGYYNPQIQKKPLLAPPSAPDLKKA